VTRHSHYVRVRLGGDQHLASHCTKCKAVIHRAAAFRLALSRCDQSGPRCPVGHPRGLSRSSVAVICHIFRLWRFYRSALCARIHSLL